MIVWVANRANLQQNYQDTALYFRVLLFYNINNLLYTLSQAISLYLDGLAVTSEYVGGKSSLGSYSFLVSWDITNIVPLLLAGWLLVRIFWAFCQVVNVHFLIHNNSNKIHTAKNTRKKVMLGIFYSYVILPIELSRS